MIASRAGAPPASRAVHVGAGDRALARPRSGGLWWVLPPMLLHAGAIWLLLPHVASPRGAEVPPTIEVELVDQAAQAKGAPSQTAPPTPPPAVLSDTLPRGDAGVPPPARSVAPPSPPARAAVNLGGGDEDLAPLSVTGPNVVPPRPEATIHNRPPFYPPEAARRGAQGVVHLVVHVTESGLPAWVDVAGSSGDASLDRAARDAVARWRFHPARQGGAPVAFDYEQDIRFTIGGR